MSILGEQLSAPAPTDHDVEQVLLGLADGSYVLSTPDGALAECGVGVVALLGASAEQLAGRPVTDVLAAATDPAQRAAFERLLHGERDDTRQAFATTTAGGAPRSLRFVVVSVPLEWAGSSRRCSATALARRRYVAPRGSAAASRAVSYTHLTLPTNREV